MTNSDHPSSHDDTESPLESGPATPEAGERSYFRRFWAVNFQLYWLAAVVAWRSRISILSIAAVLTVVLLAVINLVDPRVMPWIASWRTEKIAEWASWLSFLGQIQVVPLALLVGILIWSEMTRRLDGRIALAGTAIAMALSGIMVQLPKFIFGRPRPHLNLPDQFAWFHPDWNSFPSGHATHWFALVGALWVFSPRLSLFVTPLAVIASLARVLARAHYPSDSLAGAAFGLFFGLCFGFAALSINTKLGRTQRL